MNTVHLNRGENDVESFSTGMVISWHALHHLARADCNQSCSVRRKMHPFEGMARPGQEACQVLNTGISVSYRENETWHDGWHGSR